MESAVSISLKPGSDSTILAVADLFGALRIFDIRRSTSGIIQLLLPNNVFIWLDVYNLFYGIIFYYSFKSFSSSFRREECD